MKGCCKDSGGIQMVAWVLIVIGALNWGLIGAFGFNLVNWIFSFSEVVETVVYILVGISGVYAIVTGCHGKK